MSEVGHNSGIAGDALKSFLERVERLQEEKDSLAADIREVMAEAKSHGFDTKIIRMLLRIRKKDRQDYKEEQDLLHLYARAVGMDFLE